MKTYHNKVEMRFNKVKGFSKQKGVKVVDGLHLRCFIENDWDVVECERDAIPAFIKYDRERVMVDGEGKEAALCETMLEGSILRRADELGKTRIVDLIVVSIYDTVITVIGKKIKCVSLFSIEGYSRAPKVRRMSEEAPARNGYVVCTVCGEIYEYDLHTSQYVKCPDCMKDGIVSPMANVPEYKSAVEYSNEYKVAASLREVGNE